MEIEKDSVNEQTYEEYIKQLIKDGFVDENLNPLRCICGTIDEDWEIVNKYYCPYGIEEYSLKCNKCGRIVGHWAYGHWTD